MFKISVNLMCTFNCFRNIFISLFVGKWAKLTSRSLVSFNHHGTIKGGRFRKRDLHDNDGTYKETCMSEKVKRCFVAIWLIRNKKEGESKVINNY